MTRIQLRRDTAANWTANNPVLAAGEPAYETDTGKFKIGDGNKTYSALPYKGEGGSGGGGAEIDDTSTATDKVWSSSKTNSEIQNVAGEVVNVQADVADLDTLTSSLNTDVTNITETNVVTNCSVSTDGKTLTVSKKTLGDVDPLNTTTATYPLQKLTAGTNITITNDVISATASTPSNMVTTDTAQSITANKTVTGQMLISKKMINGTTDNQITMGQTNTFISPENNRNFGMYTSSSNGIRLNANYSSSTQNARGLSIKADTLTFTNSSGTETNLLEGGGVVKSVDTSTTGLTLDSNGKLGLASTLSSNVSAESVGASTLYFNQIEGSEVVCNTTEDTTNKNLNINAYHVGGNGATLYNTIIKGNSLKFGNRTAQYDVITKNPTDNEYMAHMAMPSDKYINLTLGASGTTYTAPADGYVMVRIRFTSTSNTCELRAIGDDTSTINCLNRSYGQGVLACTVPVSKGQTYYVSYSGALDTSADPILRFNYSIGSAPLA